MSKISQIHDALLARLSSVLPSYRQLTNPYDLEDNNELYLTKGYGVAVAPGNRTDRMISCQRSWLRTFNVVLTNQITSTDHNITANTAIQKSLLEDHFAVFSDLEKETTLSQLTLRSQVESDGGLEFLDIETARFFIMQLNISCEYVEDLT